MTNHQEPFKLRRGLKLLCANVLLAMVVTSGFSQTRDQTGFAQEQLDPPTQSQGTDFDFGFDPLTGAGANIGGIITPIVFGIGTFGGFESGADASTFANNEHDPQVDAGFQNLEGSLFLNVNNKLTGRVTGFGQQVPDGWEAVMEEYFLRYNITPAVSIGGGQFLNFFGYQAHRHLHGWDYVNNNLANARMINEGELVTQGGQLVLRNPDPDSFAMLTIGAGGVRTHAHGHDEEEEEEGHEEELHIEADGANFNDWVATADLKWAAGVDNSILGTASFGIGENGFGEMTYLYGVGLQKVWGGRNSLFGNFKELSPGALMVRTELIARSFDAVAGHHEEEEEEEGEEHEEEEAQMLSLDEQGVSASVFYGLNENAILSFRYDSVTGVDEIEGRGNYQRLSPALTTRLGPNRRFQTRFQYDYNNTDDIGEEHVGWLQLQYQWGGPVGGFWRRD